MNKVKLITVFLIPISLMSISVNQKEIKTVEPVEFEDYEGPQNKDTPEEVAGIGKNLKLGLKAGPNTEKYTWNNKYTIVRAVDPKSEKLNADIFIIEKYAKVDTIKNVRRILAGYLQEAYGYSYQDAFTLAKFITYYNAVYRSNMDYFEKKYSKKVLSYLTAENAGIAINYKEWPGNTRMVIPLTKNDSELNTTDITDDEVITNLKKGKEDRGVEDRKEIVKIKKEDLEKKKEKLEEKKEETNKKEEKIE
ncbi:MAG: P83/100 family protein, partial [Leptospirales bacterium]